MIGLMIKNFSSIFDKQNIKKIILETKNEFFIFEK